MCAIFGALSDGASYFTYLGLQALQHRGQEGAGIVCEDKGSWQTHKAEGLVADVFSGPVLETLKGSAALGHTRYATAGGSSQQNLQPFLAETPWGTVALSHNGNLTNASFLRKQLEQQGARFQTTSDTEVILQGLVHATAKDFFTALRQVLERLEGAYSLILLTRNTLMAIRDPYGFRPLVFGKGSGQFFFSSETTGLQWHPTEQVTEVQPGSWIAIDRHSKEVTTETFGGLKPWRRCIFEHVYFARPDSELFGASVYATRRAIGRRLAEEHPAPGAEVVIPVPDSGVAAALGFAEVAGIPFEMAIVRSHYMGRTFLQPAQVLRDLGVRRKLSIIRPIVAGKSIAVIDDSLVRGTTSRQILQLLREAGAREIHLRISAPPTTHPCYYGIDTPTRQELIASDRDIAAICRSIGADSLGYLSLRGLHETVEAPCGPGFCNACFTGEYITPLSLRGLA